MASILVLAGLIASNVAGPTVALSGEIEGDGGIVIRNPAPPWGQEDRVGETAGGAIGLPSVSFRGTGSTEGYHDDYDVACPDSSHSPDVVYSFVPTTLERIDFDLCGSSFDTKLYALDSRLRVLACSDDAVCDGRPSLQSKLEGLLVARNGTAGIVYFVVDGSHDQAGDYGFSFGLTPCPVTCPAGAILEGEPLSGPGYLDHYDGGCSASPPAFLRIVGHAGATRADVCGSSRAWLEGTVLQRDVDAFEFTANGPQATWTMTTEAPMDVEVDSGDCGGTRLISSRTVANCGTISHTWSTTAGSVYRVVLSPSGSDELAPFSYVLSLDGIRSDGAPTGACCFRNGRCRILSQETCSSLHGSYVGDGSPCNPDPCSRGATAASSRATSSRATWGRIKTLYR